MVSMNEPVMDIDEATAEASEIVSTNKYITEQVHRNWVRLYRRDGSEAFIAVPMKEPYRSSRLRHYLAKRDPATGERNFFAKPPCDPPVAKYACFVESGMGKCQKKLHSIADLLSHAEAKHPQECLRYGDLIQAMRKKISGSIDPALLRELNLLDDLPEEVEDQVAAEPEMETGETWCDECQREFTQSRALALHRKFKHAEA